MQTILRRLAIVAACICGVIVLRGALSAVGAGTAAPLPGPLGGPGISLDVGTMLGAKGPSFTLADGNGRRYQIRPGSAGRPLVIVSHMGYL